MLTTAYYFLQVVLCSAVMMTYYWLVLRNKKFHQYNRFYLLAIALLSWVVPLIKIRMKLPVESNQQVIRFLTVVGDGHAELDAVVANSGAVVSWGMVLGVLYYLVVLVLMFGMVHALYRIWRLLHTAPCKQLGDVFLIITQVKGTPFSFFRYIFWNDAIDIRTEAGKRILQHELTHVQQRHSADKLLIQLVLMAGWFNPFFWLLRREMELIHEFIADKKAVGDGNTAALAEMLLTAAYPQQHFALTHPFFFSPIKRRLHMLTNHNNPTFSYLRRLIVLPLLACMILLFAFRNKSMQQGQTLSMGSMMQGMVHQMSNLSNETNNTLANPVGIALANKYRIVVHPGHGGTDKGAIGEDGATEAGITLQLATLLKAQNTNNNLEIVLTRDADITQTVVETAQFANDKSPDLFLSLHVNSAAPVKKGGKIIDNPTKGLEIYIPAKEKAYDYDASYVFANMLANSVTPLSEPFLGIKSREKGIYVLQAIKCPTVLIETGFMSNDAERKRLRTPAYQQQLANAILNGIQAYLAAREKHGPVASVTDKDAITETIVFPVSDKTVKSKNQNRMASLPYQQFREKYAVLDEKVIVLDGQRIDASVLDQLDPNEIKSIRVTKTPVTGFGAEGNNGMIEIESKLPAQHSLQQLKKIPLTIAQVYVQPTIPASFPGGETAWQKYLRDSINLHLPITKGAPPGIYEVLVSFMVDREGNIGTVKIEKDPGYGTASQVARIIKNGPKWMPARQNNEVVLAKMYKKVTYNITAE